LYLQDMLEFCDAVIAYASGQTFDAWSADGMRLDATLHKLVLIGEAAMRVPEGLRLQAAEIPWRKIIGTRNRVMHAYPGVDLSTIWIIVTVDVPALRTALQSLLDRP
jgi:uncharacterized protein with HEPN domain